MKWCVLAFTVVLALTTVNSLAVTKRETGGAETLVEEEVRARLLVDKLSDEINLKKNRETIASWNYVSNITDENQKISNEVSVEMAKEYKVIEKSFCSFIPLLLITFPFSFRQSPWT